MTSFLPQAGIPSMAQPRHNQCWLVFTHADFAYLYSSLGLPVSPFHNLVSLIPVNSVCCFFFSHLKKSWGSLSIVRRMVK